MLRRAFGVPDERHRASHRKATIVPIRFAIDADIPGIRCLQDQVLELHAAGRPDIFHSGTRKYTDDVIRAMITDDDCPLFVAVAEDAVPGEIMGHVICKIINYQSGEDRQPIRTLHIDELVVNETVRRQHVGTDLYHHVLDWARERGLYNVTLSVWQCNPGARAFYEAMGMQVMKTEMESML